ncbi:MAG: hypothetical protein ACRDH5_17475, partial [bacterium]
MPILHSKTPRVEDDDFTRLRYGSFYLPKPRLGRGVTSAGRSVLSPAASSPAAKSQARSAARLVMTPRPAPIEVVLPFWRERLRQAGA